MYFILGKTNLILDNSCVHVSMCLSVCVCAHAWMRARVCVVYVQTLGNTWLFKAVWEKEKKSEKAL